jgi:hypothetical protein
MKLILPPGVDAQPFTMATAQALDAAPTVERSSSAGTRDAVTMATAILSIPPALLATWDLAERLGLLRRVGLWLDALRAQSGADQVRVELDAEGARSLRDVTAGEILDAAAATTPVGDPSAQEWDVFIIHAGADRAAARLLWVALVDAGILAYLDRASLRPGADWPRRAAAAMARTRVFLVLVSGNWDTGWYNGEEVARAISLCRDGQGRALLPLILDATHWRPDQLPYGMAHLQPIVVGGQDAKTQSSAVVHAVRGALGPRQGGARSAHPPP